MKKNLLIVVLLMFSLAINVRAQWQVYDASDLPVNSTPVWNIGDVTNGAVVNIVDDGFISGNKLLTYSATQTTKNSWKLNVTKPDNGTWVIRAKSSKNKTYGMQFEMGGTATRIDFKIGNSAKGGYLKFVGSGSGETVIYPSDSSLLVGTWHTYRITVEAGNLFKLYLDENATPVAEVTSTKASQTQFLRFGYFTSSDEAEGVLDWMSWDVSGAYAPGAGTAIPDSLANTAVKGDIMFITDDLNDSLFINALKTKGYNVGTFNTTNLALEPVSALNKINVANLVVIGRSIGSAVFQGVKRYPWNSKITVPILLVNQYIARSSRINWFESENAYHLNTTPDTIWAHILTPSDEIFADVTMVGDSLPWCKKAHDVLKVDSATNATIIAKSTYDGALLVARFEAGIEFYPDAGATEKPASPRTYFGFGNDNAGPINYYPITDPAETVLMAEVERMVNLHFTVFSDYPSDTADLASLTVSGGGTLVPDFHPDSLTYNIELPIGTTSTDVTAVAADANATVTGTGTIDLSPGLQTITVTVTAADKYNTKSYKINIVVKVPKKIVFVTDDVKDSLFIQTLVAEQYDVRTYYSTSFATEPDDTIAMINGADLVIIGRSPASNDFRAANKYAWNKKVQVPLMLCHPYLGRTSRMNWFEGVDADAYHLNTVPDTLVASVLIPGDAVFADVTLVGDSMPWSVAPNDVLRTDSATNATILVRSSYDSAVLFARFDAGIEFYPGAGATEKPAAPRTYYGFGNDNTAVLNYFPLTPGAKTVLLAEIARMADMDYEVFTDYPSDIATLASLSVANGTLDPAFNADSLSYYVLLPPGSHSAVVTATAKDANATVTGTGTINFLGLDTTLTVSVTAADKYKIITYTIEVEVSTVGVPEIENNPIRIFPNPANDRLVIQSPETIRSISIYSLQGSEVYTSVLNKKTVELFVGNLAPGIYLIKVQGTDSLHMNRIIIE